MGKEEAVHGCAQQYIGYFLLSALLGAPPRCPWLHSLGLAKLGVWAQQLASPQLRISWFCPKMSLGALVIVLGWGGAGHMGQPESGLGFLSISDPGAKRPWEMTQMLFKMSVALSLSSNHVPPTPHCPPCS